MSKVLITGGCGFIGTSLIKKMLELGGYETIRILDNFSGGTVSDLEEVSRYNLATAENCITKSGVIVIEGDIRDPNVTNQSASGVDCIVHLAANTGVGPSVENPRMDMESNVIGIFNMLEAARHHDVGKFVFASSGAPAGLVEPPIHEELPPHPISPYGASKLAGEGYCSAYYHSFNVKTTCLRFGNVYGPRSKKKASVVAKFIKLAFDGLICEIYGDGRQTRDFIYIDDLVDAIILSARNDVGGETFQIASGLEQTVQEVAAMIADQLSQYGITMKLIYKDPRVGDVARNYSDISKAQRILGWSPRTHLDEGLRKTIEYFLSEKAKVINT